MIREAVKTIAAWFMYFCAGCKHETRYELVSETTTQEVYRCAACGFVKVWKVR